MFVCLFLYVRTVIVGDSEENAEKKVWDEKFAKKCHILLVYEGVGRKVPKSSPKMPYSASVRFPILSGVARVSGWAPMGAHSHSIWALTSVRPILSVLWAPMGVPFPFYLGFDENMPNFAMSCQKKSRLHPLQMISHSICVSRVWGGPILSV